MLSKDMFERKLNVLEKEMLGFEKGHFKVLMILPIMFLLLCAISPTYGRFFILEKVIFPWVFLAILIFLLITMFELHIRRYEQSYYNLTNNDVTYTKSEYYSVLLHKERVKKEYDVITIIPMSQLSPSRVLRLMTYLSDDFVWDNIEKRKVPKPLEQIEEDKNMKFDLECIFDDLVEYNKSLKRDYVSQRQILKAV